MYDKLLLSFLGGFIVSLLITPLVAKLAYKKRIVTNAWFQDNKQIALLGGVALYISLLVGLLFIGGSIIQSEAIAVKHLIGIVIGMTIIVLGGILDDKYSLAPKVQFIFPVCAIFIVIASGIGVGYITNPLAPEKLIYLNGLRFDVITIAGIPYRVTLPADILTFIWLAVIMYSTKLQDGIDGLVSGISFIGTFFIILLSVFVFDDLELALLASLFAGVLFGFLKYNYFPGKIFLGESGSLLTGFMLGTLALLSDAKILITLLLLAIPVSDTLWTVIRRTSKGKPFWKGDKDHLHHRLIKAGFRPRKATGIIYLASFALGVLALLWQSSFTYYFPGVAVIVIVIIMYTFFVSSRKVN